MTPAADRIKHSLLLPRKMAEGGPPPPPRCQGRPATKKSPDPASLPAAQLVEDVKGTHDADENAVLVHDEDPANAQADHRLDYLHRRHVLLDTEDGRGHDRMHG